MPAASRYLSRLPPWLSRRLEDRKVSFSEDRPGFRLMPLPPARAAVGAAEIFRYRFHNCGAAKDRAPIRQG